MPLFSIFNAFPAYLNSPTPFRITIFPNATPTIKLFSGKKIDIPLTIIIRIGTLHIYLQFKYVLSDLDLGKAGILTLLSIIIRIYVCHHPVVFHYKNTPFFILHDADFATPFCKIY